MVLLTPINYSSPLPLYASWKGQYCLSTGDGIKILGMAIEAECQYEMFVETFWGRPARTIPVSQVRPVRAIDEKTEEAHASWFYWVPRGYELLC
jgi:hypothetical protein